MPSHSLNRFKFTFDDTVSFTTLFCVQFFCLGVVQNQRNIVRKPFSKKSVQFIENYACTRSCMALHNKHWSVYFIRIDVQRTHSNGWVELNIIYMRKYDINRIRSIDFSKASQNKRFTSIFCTGLRHKVILHKTI